MATLQTPDGTVIQIPDGLSADQVQSIFEAHAANKQKAAEGATLDAMPGMDKFGVGMARPIIRTALGIKQLSGSPVSLDVDDQGGLIGTDTGEPALSDDDKAVLQHLSELKGKAATAGDIVGNVAMLAAPGGMVARTASALPRTMALRGLATVGGDAAANAGVSALAVPEEGSSRGRAAAEGALGSLGGQAVGKVIGSGIKYAANGLRPLASEVASRFMGDGIPLTAGQLAGGGTQSLEDILSKMPVVGPAVRARQQEALSGWNQNILDDASPGDITKTGQEAFKQAKSQFKDAYELLWNTPTGYNLPNLGKAWGGLVDDSQKRLAAGPSNDVNHTLMSIWENDLKPGAVNGDTGYIVKGKSLEAADKSLGNAASNAAQQGQGDIANYFSQARDHLRAQMPDKMRSNLEALNNQYAQYAVARKAGGALNGGSAAPAAGGAFTPAQLLSASKALDRSAGKSNTATGMGVLQPQAQDAAQVFTPSNGKPLSVLEKTSLAIPGAVLSPLYSKTGQNILTGSTVLQKTLQKLNPKAAALSDALEDYLRPGQVGSAIATSQ